PLLRNRAAAYRDLHAAKPAVADAERALALGIAAWGTAYPEVAATRVLLGLAYIEQLGDVDRGEQQLQLALAQYRIQLGDDSVEGAICEQGLSQAGMYRGDYATALGHAERAAAVFARKLGTDTPRRGEALIGVGALRYLRKDFTGSLAAYREAAPLLGAALGQDATNVGVLHANIGETLLALGRDQDAEQEFAQALAILERKVGPRHAYLALPLKGLGLARLDRHQPREAIDPLERALALHAADPAGDPQELAEVRWALARALQLVGRDPARARELAEAALAGYRALGAQSADRVAEIARWLTRTHIP
ncbi:MAG TPA: tetratricopeptide repeat protein, partial [Kofleriaceae bacterium]